MNGSRMKVGIAMGVIAGMAAVGSGVRAAEEVEASTSLDLPVLSSYVWRGQVVNEDPVLQPSLSVEKAGFGLNIWSSMNLTDDVTGESGEFSEYDFTLSYSFVCPITGAALSLGVIDYSFPNTEFDDTREVYGSIGFDEVFLAPTLSVYYDIKEADGFYGSLAIGHSIEVSDKVSVELGASVGYADSEYNEFYFGTSDSAFNDANVSLNIPIAITDNLSITPGVSYTTLLDDDISDSVEDNDLYYGDTEKVVGVIKLSYTF